MNSRFPFHCFVYFGVVVLVISFCFPVSSQSVECKSFKFSVTIDDFGIVAVDGKLISMRNADKWYAKDDMTLDCKTRVIAVHGFNGLKFGGIQGSDESGYILTNNSWKCSDISSSGWEMPEFDDSSWPPAVVSGKNDSLRIEGIRGEAQWIWTEGSNREWSEAYCRLTLGRRNETDRTGVKKLDKNGGDFTLLMVIVAIMAISILLNILFIGLLIRRRSRKTSRSREGKVNISTNVQSSVTDSLGPNDKRQSCAYEELTDHTGRPEVYDRMTRSPRANY